MNLFNTRSDKCLSDRHVAAFVGGWGKGIFERAKKQMWGLPAVSSDNQTRACFVAVLAFEILDL